MGSPGLRPLSSGTRRVGDVRAYLTEVSRRCGCPVCGCSRPTPPGFGDRRHAARTLRAGSVVGLVRDPWTSAASQRDPDGSSWGGRHEAFGRRTGSRGGRLVAAGKMTTMTARLPARQVLRVPFEDSRSPELLSALPPRIRGDAQAGAARPILPADGAFRPGRAGGANSSASSRRRRGHRPCTVSWALG